jgi:transposase
VARATAAVRLPRPSFVPPAPIRELRDLTRHRQTLIKQQTALANRIQKLVESGNIKLAQVASDALGVSGRAMLRALAQGEQDAATMAQLARGQLKAKQTQLERALEGRLTKAQRFVLGELLDEYERVEGSMRRVRERIERDVEACQDPFVTEAVKLLQTIPGVGERVAQTIVSEIGVEMARFPSDGHLASWAGMCPGNNESAGKRKSGTTTKGSPHLRAALVQAAWAASHTKNTYLSAQYGRLAKRLGKKKALVAVGHSILVIVYHVLKERTSYTDLGGDYFDRQTTEAQKMRLIRKLEAMGMKVTVEPKEAAA